MANDITALAPVLYSAAQEVSNEPFGVISAIDARFDDKGVAIGDSIKVPVAPTRALSDFAPAMTTSSGDDATAAEVSVEITKNKHASWNLTGEQMRSLENGGENAMEWARQMVAQGMRSLRNAAEIDAAIAIKEGASRAFGTAGTTPFGSDLSDLSNARKILQDNGAPLADLQFVGDTDAGLNMRNLGIVIAADQSGSDAERRSGNIGRQFGFAITESAGIGAHTKGTGSGYLVNNGAGEAIGETAITVDTGTGTVLAGDVVTFAGDSNKYVSGADFASNTVTLGRPGLRAAAANNATLTVGNAYVANVAFERSAVVGIMRPPIMPANPLHTVLPISDDKGMTYLLVDIAGDGMRTWRLHLAWGFKAVQSEHIALVLG